MRAAPLLLFLLSFSLLADDKIAEVNRPYDSSFDWKKDFKTEPQIQMAIDTKGFSFPVSLKFVPNPGPGPKDPLYFVIEIRGTVKVVTNDRSVHVFSKDFFVNNPSQELPNYRGETGLTGICLDPKNGYVFTTFSYQDEKKLLRSAVARFSSKPGTFSLKPDKVIFKNDIFKDDESTVSHMIGPCLVDDGHLLVNVGDGEKPYESQNFYSTLGKTLRFTLDLEAPKDNPFYLDNGKDDVRDYIWALGIRNAFGLTKIGEHVVLSENGPAQDRLHIVKKGQNSNWDGSDWSIATNTLALFSPSLSPVQIDYTREDEGFTLPDDYQNTIWVAVAGSGLQKNRAGLLAVPFDEKSGRVTDRPRYILQYMGDRPQDIPAVAKGPDGMYFMPLHPLETGETPVIKMTFNEEEEFTPLPPSEDPFELLNHYGCLGCHQIWSMGSGHAPEITPNVLKNRLNQRLHSPEYVKQLDKMDALDVEEYQELKPRRDEIRGLQGIQKMRRWVVHRMHHAKFDDTESAMPVLNIPEDQATIIAEFLIPNRSFKDKLKGKLKQHKMSLVFGGGGFAAGLGLASIGFFLLGRFRKS